MTDTEPDDPTADDEQPITDADLGHVAGGKLPGEPPPRK